MERNPEKLILDILKQRDGGTINEISRLVNINRMAAAKHLAVLEAKGHVKCRSVGMAKLYTVVNGEAKELVKI